MHTLERLVDGARDRGQLGVFMVLILGAVALVVVSITLLFGMSIAGEFAIDGSSFEETESFTADTAGEYVYEVDRAGDDTVVEFDENVTVYNETGDEEIADDDYSWDAESGELTLDDATEDDDYNVTYSGSESEYASASESTTDSTGDSFELFGTSVLVIPAAAVLAVLIGGLVGAIRMRGSLPGLGGGGSRRYRRR